MCFNINRRECDKINFVKDMISQKEVEHIAQLARLGLSLEEIKKFRKQLFLILEYVNQLKKVETEGIDPISQITGLKGVWREDGVNERFTNETRGKLLKAAPLREDDLFEVKGVFEE